MEKDFLLAANIGCPVAICRILLNCSSERFTFSISACSLRGPPFSQDGVRASVVFSRDCSAPEEFTKLSCFLESECFLTGLLGRTIVKSSNPSYLSCFNSTRRVLANDAFEQDDNDDDDDDIDSDVETIKGMVVVHSFI